MNVKKVLWLTIDEWLGCVLVSFFAFQGSPYENAMLQADIMPVTRLASTTGLTAAPLFCTPRAIIVTITATKILMKAAHS
jgi:hypothetical protein